MRTRFASRTGILITMIPEGGDPLPGPAHLRQRRALAPCDLASPVLAVAAPESAGITAGSREASP